MVLRLEQLVEALQDRRRRTDPVLPGQRDGDQSQVRPQEVHLEVLEVLRLDDPFRTNMKLFVMTQKFALNFKTLLTVRSDPEVPDPHRTVSRSRSARVNRV